MKSYGAKYYKKNRDRLIAAGRARYKTRGKKWYDARRKKLLSKGWIVYFWLDATSDEKEPFYVGKGLPGRETEKHTLRDHSILSSSEIKRQQIGDRFYVEIVDTGLTEAEALVIEAHYIRKLNPECNLMPGHRIKDALRLYAGA